MNYPTILLLAACLSVAGYLIYRYCIRGAGKVGWRDVLYLGHVFFFGVLIFGAVMGGWLFFTNLQRHRGFDRQLWNGYPEQRVAMVDDLIRHHLLDAKPLAGVEGLLGTPLRVFKDSLGCRLGYYLGVRKGPFSADPEFLIVDIRNGRAGHYYVRPGVPYVYNPD